MFDSLKKLFSRKGKVSKRRPAREKFDRFMHLLAEDQVALRLIAEFKDMSSGDYLFEMEYLRLNAEALASAVNNLLLDLEGISGRKKPVLRAKFEEIYQKVAAELKRRKEIPADDFTIPLARLGRERADSVGGKMAQLGEMKNRLGLKVPEGFAISAHAYQVFLERQGLQDEIRLLLAQVDTNDYEGTEELSRRIQERIRQAPLPEGIERAIAGACSELLRGGVERLAVRSSAVGEGSEFSFAGQYATCLNVPCAEVPRYYKEIVASKFSPRALFYLVNRGFQEDETAMAVGCVAMVQAKASGVLQTVDPNALQSEEMIISSVWGLGEYLVKGTATFDWFRVSKSAGIITESRVPHKELMVTLASKEGTVEAPVPVSLQDAPSLTAEQVQELVQVARTVEQYYQMPQVMEWVKDQDDQILVLQTGPLRITRRPEAAVAVDPSRHQLLLSQGSTAAPGVGAGPVFILEKESDLARVPNGAVLVARNSSPKLVIAMNKVRALVTDVGSPTGHMATLAREFQVPALVNTLVATQVLRPGQEVTVDATRRRVYAGRVEELLERGRGRPGIFQNTPVFSVLERIQPWITPLKLISADQPDFRPESCQSFHDLTRYLHQAAMNEMFKIAEEAAREAGEAIRLQSDIPLDVHILDLGGGLKPTEKGEAITPEHIVSLPMRAFWQGMKSIPWPQPRPAAGGFLSVLTHTLSEPELQRRLAERTLAVLTESYMNFSVRLGYHLSNVEGLCTGNRNDNYIRFYFAGGAASQDRRDRRMWMLSAILERHGFSVRRRQDLIEALAEKCGWEEMEQQLQMLGRLTVYTKQMDMILSDDRAAQWFLEEFMKGSKLSGSDNG